MAQTKKKSVSIKPKYIKNEKGKTTGIYLDIKTYDAILNTLTKFDKIKKAANRKHPSTSNR